MRQKHHSSVLLVASLTAWVVSSLVGASDFVLCRGTNGHRAIEFEHSVTGCPTLASSGGASELSVQSPADCIDIPSTGTGPMTPPALVPDGVPTPPVAFIVPVQKPTPRMEMRLSASADARAGPPDRTAHLRSTVLIV